MPAKAELSPRKSAKTIIKAYLSCLNDGGEPFVLEDRHAQLRDLATADGEAAREFWQDLQHDRPIGAAEIPSRAAEYLLSALPSGARVIGAYAPLAGTGSLGRPRFAALAELRGGYVAREIKAVAPSSLAIDIVESADATADYRALEANAIRVRDPFLQVEPRWVVRRLSPESHKIEMKSLRAVEDWSALFEAMGCELANIHLGSAPNPQPLRDWIDDAGVETLVAAAVHAAALVQALTTSKNA